MGIREMVLEQAKNEGIDIAKEQVVKNLLLSKRFTAAEISNFAGVTEKFDIKVRRNLK